MQIDRKDIEEKIKGDLSNSNHKQSWSKLKKEKITCPECKGKKRVYLKPKYDPEGLYMCLQCVGQGWTTEIKE